MTVKMAAVDMRKLIVLCVLFSVFGLSFGYVPRFFRGRQRGGMVGVPKHGSPNVQVPPDMWFEQTLDHFNDADTRTWKQRYFVNMQHAKPDGPVFIQIGGEGTADPIWMTTGQWIKNAQTFGAACFQLEHRFYGKSHPTPDMSDSNLRYLSSEQALADLAAFIDFAKTKYGLTRSKVVMFGGSYPGSLAAWFRLKYPHIAHASVATSAPMYGVVDFREYLEVVRDSLATTGPGCNQNIAAAVTSLTALLATADGRKQLKDMFRLCDDVDPSVPHDIANLHSTLAGNFEGVVQYNKDNRAFEGAVGTNITIDTLCGIMTDESKGSELERYAAVNSLLLSTYGEKCQDFKYSDMIESLQATSWNSSASEGGRQWTYQTCTEFGFFQSSDFPAQPFGNFFPVEFSIQQCTDIFGSQFTLDLLQHGINRTNTNYGGLGIKVTRVVFPNGSIDPWHALGVTQDLGPDALALFIKGTAHCANMYPDSPDDSSDLIQARKTVVSLLTKWLQQD